jgi:hypothetical protein
MLPIPPTFADIPPANEEPWIGPSNAEYMREQEKRRVFKRLPFAANPYLRADGKIDRQEHVGFHAAGILFWRSGPDGIEVLMAWEDRWKKWGNSGPIGIPTRALVLLGGMRNTEQETPRDVAVREAVEESGDMISSATKLNLATLSGYVAWIPASKYCLYFHELTEPADMDVDRRFNELPRRRAGGPIEKEPAMVALAWVPLQGILDAADARARVGNEEGHAAVHPFTRDMFRTLQTIGAFRIVMRTQRAAVAAVAGDGAAAAIGGEAARREGGEEGPRGDARARAAVLADWPRGMARCWRGRCARTCAARAGARAAATAPLDRLMRKRSEGMRRKRSERMA